MKIEYSKHDATNFTIKFIENPSKYVKTCDVCNREAHLIFVVCDNVNVFCLSCFQEMKGVVDASLKLYNDTK